MPDGFWTAIELAAEYHRPRRLRHWLRALVGRCGICSTPWPRPWWHRLIVLQCASCRSDWTDTLAARAAR
jgi:hypothetical protein